ncbi:MAG: hypothetical protein WC829_03090 [Hyphomicrobium sp.]
MKRLREANGWELITIVHEAAGRIERLEAVLVQAHGALELIASPMRPDGTWNRDREACRDLAAKTLAKSQDWSA